MTENSFCQSKGLFNRFVGSEEPEGEDGNYWGQSQTLHSRRETFLGNSELYKSTEIPLERKARGFLLELMH